MSLSQLPSIDDQLVTPSNPARADVDGMDHARCAALHNYLVDYSRAVDPGAAGGGGAGTVLSTYGAEAEAVSARLHPSLASFLAAARAPAAPFFYFVDGVPGPGGGGGGEPDGLFDDFEADLQDEPADTFVRLYAGHLDACDGQGGGGLLYHQGRHRACFFVHPQDTVWAMPVDAHPPLWQPLETILSHWIALVRLGKVVASPADEPPRHGGVKAGVWEWQPYSEAQVAGCVAAWDRLCDAIETRRQRRRDAAHDTEGGGDGDDESCPSEALLTLAAMDAAQIPDPSFARAFLGRARRPRHIRQIAPGIGLPPAGAAAFAAAQPFTHLPRRVRQWNGRFKTGIVPPVYMFFSDAGAPPVAIPGGRSSFRGYWTDGHGHVPDGIAYPSHIPPGVYSECVLRSEPEPNEEAFRLPLPFDLPGARLSCGARVRNRTADELFQHGFKPGGGSPHRPQRLECLLDHWAGLVERGVWSVGPHGVMGSIDVFKDAMVDWASYTIPLSW